MNMNLARLYRIRAYISRVIADRLAEDANANVAELLADYRRLKDDIEAAEQHIITDDTEF